MDSATDVPIILTEKYAEQCADAIVSVIVKRGKLKKKQTQPAGDTATYYRVQVGFYENPDHAKTMKEKLEKAGFAGVIVKQEMQKENSNE